LDKKKRVIGGEASARSSYRTVLHRSVGLDPGVSVMIPYGNGVMGAETIKKAGEEVNLILNEDVFIKFLN
jgi:hypothetical protein